MKKTIYLFVALLFCCFINAQVITGYVYDELENKPLEAAFVYLDGTTINTTTDAKGFFQIKAASAYNAPLVVTFMGFENFVLDNPFSYNKPVKLLMKENSIALDEVVINKNLPFTRKQMLKVFREEFLGLTPAGKSCTIENEDDIKLTYNLSDNTLRASSKAPLRIKNRRLQYNVSFNLVDFQVSYNMLTLSRLYINRSFYSGTTFFTDISKDNSAEKKRKKSYLGSMVHLMKTIAGNSWPEEKFQLYVDRWPANPAKHFVITDSLSYKKVYSVDDAKAPESVGFITDAATEKKEIIKNKKKERYAVLYDGKEQSSFELANGYFYIDNNGLFSPIEEISFGGYMATLKAGDMLPADYKYEP
ncbi:MAG: hypothetical protein DI539_15565 [Flavobacterium psychrophilum]|nr:MAG: hypothetical protein DI539_15565 [Flavobacterium psychrophilum]